MCSKSIYDGCANTSMNLIKTRKITEKTWIAKQKSWPTCFNFLRPVTTMRYPHSQLNAYATLRKIGKRMTKYLGQEIMIRNWFGFRISVAAA